MSNNPYPKSNMPPARSTTGVAATQQPVNPNSGRTLYDRSRAIATERNTGRAIIAPPSGFVEYPSMRTYEKLAIPRAASDLRMGAFDEVLAGDLARHITSRVKEGFRISPSEAVSVLSHYVGCMKGLALFDERSQSGFEKVASQFTANPSEQSFQVVEQYLNSLTPEARGAE
jgi:hypothetical protein